MGPCECESLAGSSSPAAVGSLTLPTYDEHGPFCQGQTDHIGQVVVALGESFFLQKQSLGDRRGQDVEEGVDPGNDANDQTSHGGFAQVWVVSERFQIEVVVVAACTAGGV